MHELPVTENLLEIALRHASQAGATRIIHLNLVIGQFASIVDESVQFYWEIVSKNTPAEGSCLHFTHLPAELYCLDCQQTYKPANGELTCPICLGARVKILTGKEFYLESIEIE